MSKKDLIETIIDINWPITRERYRQLLAKNKRHWDRIWNLETEVEALEAKIELKPIIIQKVIKKVCMSLDVFSKCHMLSKGNECKCAKCQIDNMPLRQFIDEALNDG